MATRYDPYTRFMSFRDAMDRMFGEAFGRSRAAGATTGTLPIDMFERQDDLMVMAAIPGARPEDVDVSISDESLTIRATVRPETEQETTSGEGCLCREIAYGTFNRTVSLPFPVAWDKADAHFEDGMLHLRIPKAEKAKPKRIQVREAGSQSGRTAIGSETSR